MTAGWYVKRPIPVQAIQFDGHNGAEIVDWADGDAEHIICWSERTLGVHTLEGTMSCSPGDWIVRGVRGEFYPIRGDIFAETYIPTSY